VNNFSGVVQWEGFPTYRKEKPICYKGCLWTLKVSHLLRYSSYLFLRAIYFFFSRDVVQAQTDREIINSSGLAAAAAAAGGGGGGGGGFSFLASFLLIFYY
jgi:hypothetical protein